MVGEALHQGKGEAEWFKEQASRKLLNTAEMSRLKQSVAGYSGEFFTATESYVSSNVPDTCQKILAMS